MQNSSLRRTALAVLLAASCAAPAAFAQKRDNVLFDAATAEQPAVLKTLEKLVKDGEVGEDEGARGEKELDALTKRHVELIDEMAKNKEQELLEV